MRGAEVDRVFAVGNLVIESEEPFRIFSQAS